MRTGLADNAVISSNPFDHINQKYFDKIVALGFDAVPFLDDESIDNGVNSYIAGAIKAAKLFYEEESTLKLTEEDREKLEAIITSKDSEVEKAYQYLVKKSEEGQ